MSKIAATIPVKAYRVKDLPAGPLLDAAVALAEGRAISSNFRPSTDWVDGGPIFERVVNAYQNFGRGHCKSHTPAPKVSLIPPASIYCDGPDALVSAMRAHVIQSIGQVIALPIFLSESIT